MSKAALAQLSKYAKVFEPLLAGDANRRLIYLKSREIRNRLLDWLLENTSAEIALQFQQPGWSKYVYTNQDTDLIRAIKTIFNLLYQIHIANTLDQDSSRDQHWPVYKGLMTATTLIRGINRHQQWPVYEVLELSRCRTLLTSIFRKEDWHDTVSLFSECWPGCEKIFGITHGEPEALEEESKQLSEQFTELDEKEDHTDKAAERIDDLTKLGMNYWHSENSWARIFYLIRIYRNRSIGSVINEQSGVIQKLVKLITKLFIYLDHVEARLGAPGLLTNRLTQQLTALLDPESSDPVSEILRKQLDVQHGQFLVTARADMAKQRDERLEAAIHTDEAPAAVQQFYDICLALYAGKAPADDIQDESAVINYLKSTKLSSKEMSAAEFVAFTRSVGEDKITVLYKPYQKALFYFIDQFERRMSRVRGMRVTQKNLQDFRSRLSAEPVTPDDLVEVIKQLQQSLGAAISAIEDLQKKIPAKFAGILAQLVMMGKNLQKLQQLSRGPEIIEKYMRLQGIYARLSENIPLACRKFLQNPLQSIDIAMQRWLQADKEMAQMVRQIEHRQENAHNQLVGAALSGIWDNANSLIAAIPQPDDVSTQSSLFQSFARYMTTSPLPEQVKKDYLELLEYLQEDTQKLVRLMDEGASEAKRLPLINHIAAHIFDLRRLAKKTPLQKYPSLKDLWAKLENSIEYLRERDNQFRRAITGSEAMIEDERWCADLGLGVKVTGLVAPTPSQALETVHDLVANVRNRLMKVIADQAKDSSYSREIKDSTDGQYFTALYQQEWKKYEFNAEETTETYTLKLFLNLLYQLHQATRADISEWMVSKIPGVDWAIRLSKIPVEEIARLLEELPAFLANTGISALVQEALGLVKVLISGVSGQSEQIPVMDLTSLAASVDRPAVTPVHALLHSGAVSNNDVAQTMRLVANIGKMVPHINAIKKINQQQEQKLPAELPEKKPYTQPKSNTRGGQLINFVNNVRIFFWNKVGRHLTGLRMVRKVSAYTAIAGHVVSIAKVPNSEELATQKTVTEAGEQIRMILIKLDTAAAISGLRESEVLVQRVASQAVHQAHLTDTAAGGNRFATGWRIVNGEPFLLDRMKAQHQQIQEMADKLITLRQKVPAVIAKLIAVMNADYPVPEDIEILHSNREAVIGFLKQYAEEKSAERQLILEKLKNSHENDIKKMQDDGEKEHKISKENQQFQEQFNKIETALKGLSFIKEDSLDNLFDSVLKSGEPIELFAGLPQFTKSDLQNIAQELEKYTATHERTIRSAEQQSKNLQRAFAKKQLVLNQELRAKIEDLYSHILAFRKSPPTTMQLRIFEMNFQKFSKFYLDLSVNKNYINDRALRTNLYHLSQMVIQLENVSVECSAMAIEIVNAEKEFFVNALQDAIQQLDVTPSTHLRGLQTLLPMLNANNVSEDTQLVNLIVTVVKHYPQLHQPLQNWLALFPELNHAVKKAPPESASTLANSPMRFHHERLRESVANAEESEHVDEQAQLRATVSLVR